MHKKAIIKSAIILTSANIITRVLGFFYRIYMSKTIGAEGMGLYQIITPLYLLIWAISSSGLSTTMSKLTAQEKAKGQQGNAEKILTISLIISVAIALCLSISVHNFAEEISQYIIKDKRTTLSLKWLSPCFPFMAAGSVIRGYFLGIAGGKSSCHKSSYRTNSANVSSLCFGRYLCTYGTRICLWCCYTRYGFGRNNIIFIYRP